MDHYRVQRSEPCRNAWGIVHRDGVLKNAWEVAEWQWMDRSYVQCWSSNTGREAESFLSASHVTRTRRAHQVTAASLHILMNKAYNEYQAKSRERISKRRCCRKKSGKMK